MEGAHGMDKKEYSILFYGTKTTEKPDRSATVGGTKRFLRAVATKLSVVRVGDSMMEVVVLTDSLYRTLRLALLHIYLFF
jgi:hypothetical protein